MYHPISILHIIVKIFERHVASQLNYDNIHTWHSSFRPNQPCQTAFIWLTDTWLNDVDSGKYVGAVFVDPGKVFDLLDHTLLLHTRIISQTLLLCHYILIFEQVS